MILAVIITSVPIKNVILERVSGCKNKILDFGGALAYFSLNADQILNKVMADGAIDADEVQALRRKLQQDWIVDREEVELLFSLVQSGLGYK